MHERGLHGVRRIVSDDHAGLRAAREARFTGVPWQRCQFHVQQNAGKYVPRVGMRAAVVLKTGVDAKVISRRLGHSRASFTMDVYTHLMPGQDEEAAKRTDAGLRKALESTTRVAG